MMDNHDIRFASFNVSLNRNGLGELVTDLSTPDSQQAQNVAEIIQRNDPDVVLLNEFDYDREGEGIRLFQENYLGVSQNGVDPVEYPYVYSAPSNTGIPSGFDLDNDGNTDGPGDAYGFGFYPGQFGMVLLSKYLIVEEDVRTFQNFLWKDMPGALLPDDPTTPEPNDYYSEEELEVFRLSSKSHWDIPIEVNGEVVHVLASHPTPPVFDGEEDRNGRRNHDEIRFWADYITPGEGEYIYDDEGNFGGLTPGESFVIAGDQNADPVDGDSFDDAILQLLDNPLVNTSETPDSEGGVAASIRQGGVNDTHEGNPAFDTADFNDDSGNLRVDYVLPSEDLEITDAKVFWTTPEDPLFRLIGDFDPDLQPNGFPASDHRIVFADVQLSEADMEETNSARNTVTNLDFISEASFVTGFTFEETEVGGISGFTYDVDRETGNLYVAQEQFGISKFDAEPNGSNEGKLVDTVTEDTDLSQVPFSNLVVFGDSLSDTGNVFNATEGLIPPSPPYADGRFSNGDLIVDAIADYLELPENESFGMGGNNYAFGAAQTGEGTSEFGFLLPEPIDVPNIGHQIDLYLSDHTPTQTDLFYVYGGTNDFVSPLLRGETLPTPESIVGNITTHITELAEAGAQPRQYMRTSPLFQREKGFSRI